jgi:hypothetical protein
MDGVWHHVAMRGTVASQLVSYEPPWRLALSLEEPTKEAGSGFPVPPILHQKIQDLTILIHGSIQIAQPSIDPNKDFIDEPMIAAGTRSLSKPIRVNRAKAKTPPPDRFIRYVDPTFGE